MIELIQLFSMPFERSTEFRASMKRHAFSLAPRPEKLCCAMFLAGLRAAGLWTSISASQCAVGLLHRSIRLQNLTKIVSSVGLTNRIIVSSGRNDAEDVRRCEALVGKMRAEFLSGN